MEKERAPAFQLYAAEWLSKRSFIMASLEERGAIFTAMLHSWDEEPLPEDVPNMTRLFSCNADELERAKGPMLRELEPKGDGLTMSYVEREKIKQEERRANSSAGGKKSAEIRWGTRSGRQDPPEPPKPKDEEAANYYNGGSEFLQTYEGVTNKDARAFLGKILKDHGKEAATFALDAAKGSRPVNAFEFIVATAQAKSGKRGTSKGQASQDAAARAKERLKSDGK